MTDLQLIAWFTAHPDAMASFDAMANRYGQNLEAALAPPGHGFDGCVMVRHEQDWLAVWVIHPDGRIEGGPTTDLPE